MTNANTTTEFAKMTDTLRHHGAWAHGPEEPEVVAELWIAEGVTTTDELEQWLSSGVFDADAAGELRRAGVAPADVEGGLGHDFANGDIELEKVLAHLGGR